MGGMRSIRAKAVTKEFDGETFLLLLDALPTPSSSNRRPTAPGRRKTVDAH